MFNKLFKKCALQKSSWNFAKLSPAQSNFNSVGWADLALIPTFTPPSNPPPLHHPQGKYWEGNFNMIIDQI